MMGEPRGAPLGSDMVVMGGHFGNIHVWGDRIYNTQRTKQIPPRKRKCFFSDESPTGLGTKYYIRRNCKVACYMDYVLYHCGCYLEFMVGLMSRKSTAGTAKFRNSVFQNTLTTYLHVVITVGVSCSACYGRAMRGTLVETSVRLRVRRSQGWTVTEIDHFRI